MNRLKIFLIILMTYILYACGSEGGDHLDGSTTEKPANSGDQENGSREPKAVIQINNGDRFTTAKFVIISLQCPLKEGCSKFQLSNDKNSWTLDLDYSSSAQSWTLNSGEGTKDVFVRFSKGDSAWSDIYSDDVILDTQPPYIASFVLSDGSDYTTAKNITFRFSGSDAMSGLKAYFISENAAAPSASATGWVILSNAGMIEAEYELSEGAGTKTVYLWLADKAGNITAVSANDSIIYNPLDGNTGGIGKNDGDVVLTINQGYEYTNKRKVTVNFSSLAGDHTAYFIAEGSSSPPDIDSSGWIYVSRGSSQGQDFELIAEDGVKTLSLWLKNSDGILNNSKAALDTIVLDTVSPVISSFVLANSAAYTNQEEVEFSFSAYDTTSGLSSYFVSTNNPNPALNSAGWKNIDSLSALSFRFDGNEGEKKLYFWLKDKAGNITTNPAEASIIFDKTPPSVSSLILAGGAEVVGYNTVFLNIVGYDVLSGLKEYHLSENNALPSVSSPDWQTIADGGLTALSYRLSSGDGTKTVYARLKDRAGNISTAFAQDDIYLNTSIPSTSSFILARGLEYVNSRTVTLDITSTGGIANPKAYYASEDSSAIEIIEGGSGIGGGIANPKAYFASEDSSVIDQNTNGWIEITDGISGLTYQLSAGNGNKTVYLWIKDDSGNYDHTPAEDSVYLDTTPPELESVEILKGESFTDTEDITLAITGSDSDSGLSAYFISESNTRPSADSPGWRSISASESLNELAFTLSAGENIKTVNVWLKDRAGNISTPSYDTVILDETAPEIMSFSLNDGARFTNSPNIVMTFSTSDSGSGVSEYYAAENSSLPPASSPNWKKIVNSGMNSLSFQLSSGDYEKTIYLWARDHAGNISSIPASSSISLDRQPPVWQSGWNLETENPGWQEKFHHTSLVFDNRIWVIGGYNRFLSDEVWSSSDGVEWVLVTENPGWSPRYGQTSLVFDNRIWVIGGYDGSNTDEVWSSTDGVNWVLKTEQPGWQGRHSHTSVVFDNRIWVIGGYAGSYSDEVWSSSDGVDWVLVTDNPGWSVRLDHTSLVFDNRIWVIGGTTTGNYSDEVWSSSDGVDWVLVTDNPGWLGRFDHTSLVFDNRIWILGGQNIEYDEVWSSTDGLNWLLETSNSGRSNGNSHTSVVFDNRIWIIEGKYKKGGSWEGSNEVQSFGLDHISVTPDEGNFVLSWQTPRDQFSGPAGYKLVWSNSQYPEASCVSTSENNIVELEESISSYTLTNIQPDTDHYFRICAVDKAGNFDSGLKGFAPKNDWQININNADQYTNSSNVRVNLSCPDGNCDYYQLSNDNNAWSPTTVYTQNDIPWTLSDGDGFKRVYVRYSPDGIVWGQSYDTDIILDTTPPSISSVKINGGSDYTTSSTVNIEITFSEGLSGVSEYLLKHYPSENARWLSIGENSQVNISVNLGDTESVKNIYIWLKDKAGNITSSPGTDSIILDRTPPQWEFFWKLETDNPGWEGSYLQTSTQIGGKIVLIGGLTGSIFKKTVFISDNGINWRLITDNPGWLGTYGHTSAYFNNKLWLLGGYDGSYLDNIYSSSDGTSWQLVTNNPGWAPRLRHTTEVFNGKIWVIGGSIGSPQNSATVWSSVDGSSWQMVTDNPGWGERKDHKSVVFKGKLWVIGGSVGNSFQDSVWSSVDGLSWELETDAPGWTARSKHSLVLFDDKIWLIGGESASQFSDKVWSSQDGIDWTQVESPGLPSLSAHNAEVFDGKIWIMGGKANNVPSNSIYSYTHDRLVADEDINGVLTLSWSSPNQEANGVEGYRLMWSSLQMPDNGCAGSESRIDLDSITRKYEFTDLITDIPYHFRLCAVDSAGNINEGITRIVVMQYGQSQGGDVTGR